MRRDLPPLSPLRTFEAAARHGSFTEAARELHVTHSAVSRAIQSLEAWLGVPLFHRIARRVSLTKEGDDYLREVEAAFDRIALATGRLKATRTGQPLYVEALPTFAMHWLVPRLLRFYERNPTIDVRLRTSDRVITTEYGGFDVVIRRGPEKWPGFRATRFLDEQATPVCSPRLLHQKPLRHPRDLANHTLLYTEKRPEAWDRWLKANGLEGLKPAGTRRFDHFYVVHQAALDGLGVALGALPVLGPDLDSGRLVAPFPERLVSARSYHALVRRERAEEPALATFIAWLVEEGSVTSPRGGR